jgi:predicted AAA+ superfamily ATPase
VSYANIAADVGISPVTVKKYINLLETLYIIFIIRPHSKKISRSILKEPKIYFYDNGVIENEGLRFENLVAIALLAAVQKKRDLTGDKLKLSYLKTKEGHEIDFAIIENDKNILKVFEAKLSDEGVGKSLKYFVDKYDLHATQIVKNAGQDKMLSKNISIKTAQKSLSKISSLI